MTGELEKYLRDKAHELNVVINDHVSNKLSDLDTLDMLDAWVEQFHESICDKREDEEEEEEGDMLEDDEYEDDDEDEDEDEDDIEGYI